MLKETAKKILPAKVYETLRYALRCIRHIRPLCCGRAYIAVMTRGERRFSYSQNGEDIFVRYALHRVSRGDITYMDVGCNDPYALNNTALLTERFKIKKGVVVEPNPDMCKKIVKARPNAVCMNIGLCPNGRNSRGGGYSYILCHG